MARFIPGLGAFALTSLCATMASAGEAAGGSGGGGGGGGKSLFQMVIDSGPVEWVLILLSVVGVSIGIHRLLTIRREILVPDGLADDLHNIFAEGVSEESVEDALNVVSGDNSMLGEVLSAALDKKDFGYESMSEAAEVVGNAEHNKYMTQISWLSLFAAVGPMLGLLGTVVGMIGAFMKMAATGGNVNPELLSREIGGAMITTATGLIIAIPMIFLFFFLRARINKCMLDASVLASEVLDYFRAR